MKSIPLTCAAVFLGLNACIGTTATAAEWIVDQTASTIEFTAFWSGAPTKGQFPEFEAAINFDEENLSGSSARIDINLMPINAEYPRVADTLITEEWFDAAAHSQATFETETITGGDGGAYRAIGNLQLRGVTKLVELNFSFETIGADPKNANRRLAIMNGEARLSRSDFGIGQGDWSDATLVGDEVVINTRITAYATTKDIAK
jgi:polyisoprenoid-binding protein YceI